MPPIIISVRTEAALYFSLEPGKITESRITVTSKVPIKYFIQSGPRNQLRVYSPELFPVRPQFVGHRPPQIVMGKKSGVDNVLLWAEELGIQLKEDEIKEVLNKVKRRSTALKRLLSKDEFREIIEGVREKTWSLVS